MRAILAAAMLCIAGSLAHAQVASCYGNENHQVLTATGERYDPNGLTAAHRTLPFGTMVRITNLCTGKSVIVRINDCGPFLQKNGKYSRDIDLSLGACRAVGNSGIAPVRLDYMPRHGDFGAF